MRTLLRVALALGLNTATAGAEDGLFRERVAPILEKRCVHCHGAATRHANLSLATAAEVLHGGDGGPAIVPGKPEESLLLEMVAGEAPAMPRKGERLAKAEVDALRRWVAEGARWPKGLVLQDRRFEGQAWWAFEPLARPRVPIVKQAGWVRTPIDAFILNGLEGKGLRPSTEADRRTLIRRLTYDLHGLPPTPEEVDAFLSDARPDAYEKLVDRLLESPRYGERWGRHWLDVVHYGDTHGYDKDKRRDNAWPYRDYVIRCFNDDVPYGRFIREQLAGDVLFPGDPRGIIATGFIAAGPWDFVGHVELREGTVDKLKARLIDRDDMVASAMATFQSLTVHCARCHDHKFDPIPQRDYYRLQAVFAGVDRGDRPRPSPEAAARRSALAAQRDAAAARADAVARTIDTLSSPALAALDQTLHALRKQLAAAPTPAAGPPSPTNGYHSAIHPGPDAAAWVQVDLGRIAPIDEIRLIPARPTDFPDTPGFGFPTAFRVELADESTFAHRWVVAEETRPDQPNVEDVPTVIRPGGAAARFVRIAASRLWKRSNDYVFALSELEVMSAGENIALGKPVQALDSIEAGRWSTRHLVDGHDSRHARPPASDPAAARTDDLRYQIRQLERERARRLDALIDPTLRAERAASAAALAAVEAQLGATPPTEMVYGVQTHAPRPIHVLHRGDVEQPGAEAKPGALSCVPGLEPDFKLAHPNDEGSRRAALAAWVASPSNPLTWRSIVNRAWHYHFGRGIVDTPNDFGRNGSRPTHPALLDWLAVEFRDGGQSFKQLDRLLVTSAVYRQASAGNPLHAKVDADNRLLWRMNRTRLDAEEVRDSVLAVSGALDPTMGGPGFALFRFKDDHSPIYDHAAPEVLDLPGARRRTVYRFTVRSVPNPFLDCMDSADPNANVPVRNTTITALQALAMLNDLFVIKQSKQFATRLERSALATPSRIEAAYALALARRPTSDERSALTAYADKHGLANACLLLFNMNEFHFID